MGKATVKFKFFLSVFIAAFLVVGTAAHGATHDYTPDVGQELVECQACHTPFSETEATSFEHAFPSQSTRFQASAQESLPNQFGQYRSRAPPKF